jgi:carbohydrate kinase (thermoresistant glucokinase family)
LKKTYRTILAKGIEDQTHFFLLNGNYELIMNRLQERKGHYMPPTLLQSQFDILEVTDEVIEVDVQLEASEIVAFITTRVSHR